MTTSEKITILILTSDPSDAARLRLDQELRDIREKLQLARMRDRFILETRTAVRPGDLTQAIFDTEPQIVQFSGHGTNAGELYLENELGRIQPVSADALAALFELVSNQVQCVILNACYSEIQAKAIAKYIKYVVGMSNQIAENAATSFAIGFYKALGAGRSIEEAYKFGVTEIKLCGIPERLTPVLLKKNIQVRGKINFPQDGTVVPRYFRANGSIEDLPADFHLYLTVEVEGLNWPKEQEIIIDGTSWKVEVYEGGSPPSGRFSLCLYIINDEGHQFIQEWFEKGQRTGNYPGLPPQIKGSLRLHKINLRLKE